MSLQSTNISTTLVANALGIGSHSVGLLCSKASVGGIGTSTGYNSAFAIVENGYTNTDGKLITGALPLYNIYSTGAPAQWTLPVNPADFVYYRLLRDNNYSRYCFKLGGFRGYNANATAPSLSGYQFDLIVNSNNAATLTAEITANVGDYDWISVLGATGVKLTVWDGTTKKGQSEIKPITLSTNMLFTGLSFTENLTFDKHKIYTVYLSLINESNNEIGRLPVTNTITVNVTSVAQHSNVFNINLPETLGGSFSEMNTDSGTLYKTYIQSYETYLDNPMYLIGINYTKYNSSNAVIGTLAVTSFGTNDAPLMISHIRENIPITFKADYSRIQPNLTLGEWVEITMQYDY